MRSCAQALGLTVKLLCWSLQVLCTPTPRRFNSLFSVCTSFPSPGVFRIESACCWWSYQKKQKVSALHVHLCGFHGPWASLRSGKVFQASRDMISICAWPQRERETLYEPWSILLWNHLSPILPLLGTWYPFSIFYLKHFFLHHFCSLHLASPCQQRQEAHFRGGRTGPSTPVMPGANMSCQPCAGLPTGHQLEGSAVFRMQASLQSPGLPSLPAFHLPHRSDCVKLCLRGPGTFFFF